MIYRRHFIAGKKGAHLWAKLSGAKAPKVMAITDACGAVLSISIESESPHEFTLIEKMLDKQFINELIKN